MSMLLLAVFLRVAAASNQASHDDVGLIQQSLPRDEQRQRQEHAQPLHGDEQVVFFSTDIEKEFAAGQRRRSPSGDLCFPKFAHGMSWVEQPCTSSSTCTGGNGPQPCSTCQSFGCNGVPPQMNAAAKSYCSCNNDADAYWFGAACDEDLAADSQCKPDDVCVGGNGPQPCSTCQTIGCTENGCCCQPNGCWNK